MLLGMFNLELARLGPALGGVSPPAPESLWGSAWALVVLGLASGALLGLRFHDEQFLGGYGSWRRRLARLGHIACIALALLQMAHELSPAGALVDAASEWRRALWTVGGFAMPVVCWLAAWRPSFRRLFFLPVTSLCAAATLTSIAVGRANGVVS